MRASDKSAARAIYNVYDISSVQKAILRSSAQSNRNAGINCLACYFQLSNKGLCVVAAGKVNTDTTV